jgi:hypothetical protein
MNRNDVIDVLTVITAGDGRREPGPSDIEFWCEIIGDLSKDLAMQAVKDHFRTKPGVWLEPGHIVARAREIRRDMLDREPDFHRSPPIEDEADSYYQGDIKAAPDLPPYPRHWTSQRRVAVYWYAMSLRAVPSKTSGWQALSDQLDKQNAKREHSFGAYLAREGYV